MRAVAAAIVLLLLFSCGSEPEQSINFDSIRRDSILHDSLLCDSLRIDSLRRDSIARIPPPLLDTSFIPKGYRIKSKISGNLNLDAYPDVIVVLKHDSEEPGSFSEMPRPVFVFLGDSAGHYNLEFRNDYLTMCQYGGQMAGEPFDGIEIDSGRIVVNHYGGSRYRWTSDFVFDYDPAKQTWFYTYHYATAGDMLGELDSTGMSIPIDSDTLAVKRKTDIRKFHWEYAETAQLQY